MLPKQNRLKKQKDFDRVFKQGKGFKQGFLFLKISANNLKVSRFGFVVSKNFSKKAVERNKMKRRLREIIKLKLNKIKKGMDGIIIVYPNLKNKEFSEIEKALDSLLKKAKML